MTIWRERVDELEESLKISDIARNDLQRALQESAMRQDEEQAKMSKYSEIVAQENKSLNQQVLVLNELLASRDEELLFMKSELSQKSAQI